MPLFTAETAREAQRSSAESRRANRMAGGRAQPQAAPLDPAVDGFVGVRLARVRTQLERLDALVTAELDRGNEADGQRVDRLVSASARLEEQERRLSGRSLPPTKRGVETPKRSRLLLGEM